MLIDAMEFAYAFFQLARHAGLGGFEPTALYQVTRGLLQQVREQGAIAIELPESQVQALSPDVSDLLRHCSAAPQWQAVHVSAEAHSLLDLCLLAIDVIEQLWPAEVAAVRSLGYSMHNIPALIRSGGFNRESFEFCFRIVAHHWAVMPQALRQRLCALAGLSPERAEELIKQEGFAIDMYRSPGAVSWADAQVVDRSRQR